MKHKSKKDIRGEVLLFIEDQFRQGIISPDDLVQLAYEARVLAKPEETQQLLASMRQATSQRRLTRRKELC